MLQRKCTKCKRVLDSSMFFKSKKGKYGLMSICKECNNKKTAEWRNKNPQRFKELNDKYQHSEKGMFTKKKYQESERGREVARVSQEKRKNSPKRAQYEKEYEKRSKVVEYRKNYKKNTKSYKIAVKKWRDKNKKHLAEYRKNLAIIDPVFRMRCNFSRYISTHIRKGGKSCFSCLPYSIDDLREHLESQFEIGMEWNNYGKWHIDHIIPVKLFNIKEMGDAAFLACWGLENLQPLWAIENLRKRESIQNQELYNKYKSLGLIIDIASNA